jgi:hypothetical protein
MPSGVGATGEHRLLDAQGRFVRCDGTGPVAWRRSADALALAKTGLVRDEATP